jgi:hypothetical protein
LKGREREGEDFYGMKEEAKIRGEEERKRKRQKKIKPKDKDNEKRRKTQTSTRKENFSSWRS